MVEALSNLVRFRYEPSPRQLEWINPYAREKMFGGAKRGGKSVAIGMHIALLCMAFPGNRGLMARKNATDLKDSTLDEFLRTVPSELYDHRLGDRKLVFHNGSECLYRGLGDAVDFEKAKSMTLGFLAIDEPSEVPFDAFSQLNAQMTHVLPNGQRPPYMALLGCNPEPGWVKDRYVSNPVPGSLYVQALPKDNPGLPPNWESDLRRTMPADWVRRYLEGSWDVFEGQIFVELLEQIHNLDNWTATWKTEDWKKWSDGLRKIGCIDHATTGITTYQQVGIDRSENMFSMDEYYRSNRLISEHALDIKQLQREYAPQDYTLIDPSTAAKTQQGPYELFSYLDEYRRNGILATPARRASIEVGINLLQQFMHVNPLHKHPFTGQLGSPHYFISKSRCPNLWKEFVELRKELLPAGGVRYLGADHGVDCVRYIAMSRPAPPLLRADGLEKLSTLDQKQIHSHTSWAKKFDKSIENNKGEGSYW